MNRQPLIVSRLTPAGAGAVAVVQLRGRPSLLDDEPRLFHAANGRFVVEQSLGCVCYGTWGTETPESVVLCRTEAELTEIHCHGGSAAVARIVADLKARNCTTAEAVKSGPGLIEEECREALIRATTLRTADILLQQLETLPSLLHELPGSTGDDALRQVEALLSWAEFGRHLTSPWRVVLCGRPNVGKSSLINALVGFARSIVFDQPGTTRDVVVVETALHGWPIEFLDTAGIREDADELESLGIARARKQLESADLRIVLLDVSQQPSGDDRELLAAWSDGIIVAHKCDLDDVWGAAKPQAAIDVSSVTGAGVDALADEIVRRLVPLVPEPMTPVPVTRRQVEALRVVRDAIQMGMTEDEIARRMSALAEG